MQRHHITVAGQRDKIDVLQISLVHMTRARRPLLNDESVGLDSKQWLVY